MAIPAESKIVKVVYTQSKTELPTVFSEVSEDEYVGYFKEFIEKYGKGTGEKIMALPAELKYFVDTIKHLPPHERAMAIEEFVREIGYYDFENKETKEEKDGKPPAERLAIMAARMDNLKKGFLKGRTLGKKMYAGVCADFAVLTAALMRESGLIAGVAQGYRPSDKK